MRVKQKGIRNTPNKPWWVEIVTSRNRLYRPYAISEHSLFIYIRIENLPMNFFRESQTSTNTSKFKHQYRREIAWSLNHCRRFTVEKAWFSKYVTFSIDFRNIYITIIGSPICCWFISLVILVNKGDFSHLGTYTFLTSSVHVPLNTVFNQIW